jgi:diaminohydroxyphosphoribosylaminopyrimidine deaminase/5-amino-6-(5-phosphoribosylamino)uracil reductase
MRRALALAERGWGRVSPNPLVGCVLVRDGLVVGEGWHEGPGTEHAEAMALRVAGDRAAGATAVVTLEPCSHHGRTPPCAPALVAAGVESVIAAVVDPNPIVDGSGFQVLRDAGLTVEHGLLEAEAVRQNLGFRTHVTTGLPFVVLKMASSLDGRAAARDGSSRWISGEPARADVQRLRAWADAVVVGSGTVLADDPQLTIRDPAFASARPPIRVIVDPSGRVRGDGRVFDAAAPTLVATTELAPADRREAWAEAGVGRDPRRDRRPGRAVPGADPGGRPRREGLARGRRVRTDRPGGAPGDRLGRTGRRGPEGGGGCSPGSLSRSARS